MTEPQAAAEDVYERLEAPVDQIGKNVADTVEDIGSEIASVAVKALDQVAEEVGTGVGAVATSSPTWSAPTETAPTPDEPLSVIPPDLRGAETVSEKRQRARRQARRFRPS